MIKLNQPNAALIPSLDVYLASMEQAGRKQSYIDKSQRNILEIFQECDIDRIEELTTSHVEQWIESKSDQGFSTFSINSIVSSLRTFLRWCVTAGKLLTNPLAGLASINIDHEETIDRHQVRFQRLFKTIESLSSLRYGASLEMVHESQLELGNVCMRTTLRDMQLLQNLGMVYRERNQSIDLMVYKLNTINPLIQSFSVKRNDSPASSRMATLLAD